MALQKPHMVVHSKERKINANIIEKCDEEKTHKHLLLSLPKTTNRAAMYAGVSYSTIKKIREENKERKETNVDNYLKSPGKKRRVIPGNIVSIDDFDTCVISNVIQDFYVTEKRVPTIPKLPPIVKSKISFPWARLLYTG
ncbi:hypothetical protein ANN_08515 [Periplaneta americana]|uniref:Uncharacterized protein n=1 Tax=Periplaneta americana TaxID=6978 RepID=A0ABQ8T2T8_PERAM|nr:hypothetical protein ANN_08515 [Periplaneta americana]